MTGSALPVPVPAGPARYNVNLPVASPAGSIALAILGNDYLVDLELSALQADGDGHAEQDENAENDQEPAENPPPASCGWRHRGCPLAGCGCSGFRSASMRLAAASERVHLPSI